MALGADDPLLFGSRLAAQYRSARRDHHLSDTQLADLARHSLEASAAPDHVRIPAIQGIDAWLADLPVRGHHRAT